MNVLWASPLSIWTAPNTALTAQHHEAGWSQMILLTLTCGKCTVHRWPFDLLLWHNSYTSSIIHQIRAVAEQSPGAQYHIMHWACNLAVFLQILLLREITVSSWCIDPNVHLSWGGIAVDDSANPLVLQWHSYPQNVTNLGNGCTCLLIYNKGGSAVVPFSQLDGSSYSKISRMT